MLESDIPLGDTSCSLSSFEEKLTHFQGVSLPFDFIHPRFVSPGQAAHRRKERRAFEFLLAVFLVHGFEGVPDQTTESLITQKVYISLLERSKMSIASVVRILHLYFDNVCDLGVDEIILAPVAIALVQQNGQNYVKYNGND